MNFGISSALRGVPALLGVLLGVWQFSTPAWRVWYLPMLLVSLVLLLWFAMRLFNSNPLVGIALLEPWTFAAIAIVAMCTGTVLWLTTNLETLLDIPSSNVKAVSGALVGAFTTFVATAWLKEIQESNGAFVASSQAKSLFARFAVHHRITGDNVIHDCCYADVVSVSKGKIKGWGLKSRWKRALLLHKYLSNGKIVPSR